MADFYFVNGIHAINIDLVYKIDFHRNNVAEFFSWEGDEKQSKEKV